MKKIMLVIVTIALFALCGCSSQQRNMNDVDFEDTYENGYDEGYEDGYESGYEDGCDIIISDKNFTYDSYEDEYHSFQMVIVNLMYDQEYETVEKILDYYSEGVETALENEFGTTDIPTIKEYIDGEARTAVGNCQYCKKSVYANDAVSLANGDDCAHSKCFFENNSFKIDKKR